ncbi:hypothetical protein MSAN_02475900 [Mycena sanguinolenta]|uniref:DUF6534 domain-containing protein n=1 Tax=Mycena sanguinolenta TaxID=230812 RepID=A0A8H6WTW8_9AGAR|nr:hypothetical protein MSAN_02475900 [Mycena sanguinolenta]
MVTIMRVKGYFLCPRMASNQVDIPSTQGIWMTAVFLEAILHGMGLLQGFLYFVWFHRDPWSIKGTVIAMLPFKWGAAYSNVYELFVTNFANFESLNTIHRQDSVQLTALFLSIFIAQAHFARCVYQLHKRHIILPLTIFIFSLVALGAGIAQVVQMIRLKLYSNLGVTSLTSNLQAAFALAADLLITFGLCWRLNKNRGGIQSTNKILNFLILTAINRGVFTMFFAALNIALFVRRPNTFYFMLALLLSDKFYLNSMLAMLNTREYAVHLSGSVVEHVSLSTFAARSGTAPSRSNDVVVSRVQETQYDDEYFTNTKLAV